MPLFANYIKDGPIIMHDACESHLNVKFFAQLNLTFLCFRTMERYRIEERVKIVGAFYENGRSNQQAFHAIRDFLVSIIDQMCLYLEVSSRVKSYCKCMLQMIFNHFTGI